MTSENIDIINGWVIARGGLNLRRSPKTGAVIKTLRRGSKVEILGQEQWVRVRASNGSVGFVLGDHVERLPTHMIASESSALSSTGTSNANSCSAESDVCIIRRYHNSRFIGEEIFADLDFHPHLDRINGFAADFGIKVSVTSSAREPNRDVEGAIVRPARCSNHLVGHAIDMNLRSGSHIFNSSKLKKSNFNNLPVDIQKFICQIRDDTVLRWGGDFLREDPVHIDDKLNLRNPNRWDAKLASRR